MATGVSCKTIPDGAARTYRIDQVNPICATTEEAPTAASSTHSRGEGAIQERTAGMPQMSAPPTQNKAKISHAPSVLRTWRITATAAPERMAEMAPTTSQTLATPVVRDVPSETSTTPQVASARAPTDAASSDSPRNSAAQTAVKTGAV